MDLLMRQNDNEKLKYELYNIRYSFSNRWVVQYFYLTLILYSLPRYISVDSEFDFSVKVIMITASWSWLWIVFAEKQLLRNVSYRMKRIKRYSGYLLTKHEYIKVLLFRIPSKALSLIKSINFYNGNGFLKSLRLDVVYRIKIGMKLFVQKLVPRS